MSDWHCVHDADMSGLSGGCAEALILTMALQHAVRVSGRTRKWTGASDWL